MPKSPARRIANFHEIWLYPDGTLHEYLCRAYWETEHGWSTREYIGTALFDEISLDDLYEALEMALMYVNEDDELLAKVQKLSKQVLGTQETEPPVS